MYSSGDDGAPQGGADQLRGLDRKTIGHVAEFSGLSAADCTLMAGPMYHVGAFDLPGIGTWWVGGSLVILPRFDAGDLLATVERERATHAFVVPTMINTVLALPDPRAFDLSSLRQLIYGAAPMSPSRIREAWELFGPVLSQGFGCGETTSGVLFLTTEDHRRAIEGEDEELLLSCGRALAEAEVAIVGEDGRPVPDGEIGEIAVRGPNVVDGYWNEPELTAETFRNGWFHTGDMARRDADGYLYIVDRKKDMIVSGGENIYAVEVEAVLYQHPAVFEAAVVASPRPAVGRGAACLRRAAAGAAPRRRN